MRTGAGRARPFHRVRNAVLFRAPWRLIRRHPSQQLELKAKNLDPALENAEARFEAIDLYEDQVLVEGRRCPLADPVADEPEGLLIRAQKLFGKVKVPARGQELARLQPHLGREPPLSVAHLRLLHVDLTLGDAYSPSSPPVEVEGNAQPDVDVVVRPSHILLTPEVEHGVRTERSLAQTASGGIDVRPQSAKLRVFGNRSLHYLIDRERPGSRRRLGKSNRPAREQAEEQEEHHQAVLSHAGHLLPHRNREPRAVSLRGQYPRQVRGRARRHRGEHR